MPRPFLTARWQNLILATYAVPEELLLARLPPGAELDRRDGQCFASLVGFQFLDTRVFGIGWPGYRNFPEWNLRFYVRHAGRRGVCFLREFVPQRLVATVARLIYNEPYRVAGMSMRVEEREKVITTEYTVSRCGRTHRLAAVGDQPAVRAAPGSLEHFFKEHSWGFGVTRGGELSQYEVTHPEWEIYPIRSFAVEVDWAALYGAEWGVMNNREPASVMLAAGSAVSVFPKNRPHD